MKKQMGSTYYFTSIIKRNNANGISARVVPDTTSDTVTKGYTYKLTVSAVVKGITQPTVTVSKTY